MPVAAAVLEEVRQVEKREGTYRFSEGWIPERILGNRAERGYKRAWTVFKQELKIPTGLPVLSKNLKNSKEMD